MANPDELTITYVPAGTRVDYPDADIIDESGEIAVRVFEVPKAV